MGDSHSRVAYVTSVSETCDWGQTPDIWGFFKEAGMRKWSRSLNKETTQRKGKKREWNGDLDTEFRSSCPLHLPYSPKPHTNVD